MSDHIEVDGRKYFHESYLQGANATSKRRGERIAELEAQLAAVTDERDNLRADFGEWDAALKLKTKLVRELAEALEPFAFYVSQFNRRPMLGVGYTIHSIHYGSEYAAEITRSQCEVARQLLARPDVRAAMEGK